MSNGDSEPNIPPQLLHCKKTMTFEFARLTRITIAIYAAVDQQSCFNRIWPAVINVPAQADGAKTKELHTRPNTIDEADRRVKIGMGVFQKSNRN